MFKRNTQLISLDHFMDQYRKQSRVRIFYFGSAMSAFWSSWFIVGLYPWYIAAVMSCFSTAMFALIDGSDFDIKVNMWIDKLSTTKIEEGQNFKILGDNPAVSATIATAENSEERFLVETDWVTIQAIVNASFKGNYLVRDSLAGEGIENLTRKWGQNSIQDTALKLGLVDKYIRFRVGGFVVPEVEE